MSNGEPGIDRNRVNDLEPIGVIDIGSNSVRLVIYEGAVRSPTPIFNEKVLCGLGRTVGSTKQLGHEAIERAIAALSRFRSIARILGVKNLRAIATAAAREAENGRDFIVRAEKAAGMPIEILSGEQEAKLAANGIFMGFDKPDGIAGDLGGGSLELINLAGHSFSDAVTLPLGGLRLIDVSSGRTDRALEIADGYAASVPWLNRGEGRTFFAVGGTWRSLAKLHMEMHDYPLRVMHGYRLPASSVIAFCETIRKAKKLLDLKGMSEVSKARREVLPYGALALERVLRRMRAKDVVFSVYGIREGLVYSLLSPAEQRKDPLVAFAEDYARLNSRSPAHAAELCRWTDAIFVTDGPKESDEERRLRHAACLLSDIGWRAHPDFRGEQSLNVIAHAALGGIEHNGRIFLALTVYYRHVGPDEEGEQRDEFSSRLKAIISKRMLRRARILGAAIRAAHMLSIGRPGIIDDAPLSYEGNRLVLTLPDAHRALDGERLQRRFNVLAKLLEREPEIRKGT